MRKTLWALLVSTLAVAGAASAADPVDGRWRTLDDETGRPMSVVEVSTTGGTLSARVVETLNDPNAKCAKCSGADKNKPIVGMRVLWDLKKKDGVWGDGSGFKPSSGDSFRAKTVQLAADGRTLEVTGCKLMFCRTAKWERAH
ncbi:MAG: DUF2147 domain-containing protein [Proteobacteria bacterium]|nr:DUF2147 domain-containing protein [Pseudomonadota bacterium]